jgi:hypothetical protein
MNSNISIPFIPDNYTGKQVDLEKSVTEENLDEASITYNRACKRLLNPPIWHELAGSLSARFILVTPDQVKIKRLIQLNDFLMIDIPGPGSSAGDGYDWVTVENIAQNIDARFEESFGMILRTSLNPRKPESGNAHFFGRSATSTFIVKRNTNVVVASYHGRNEQPNTDNVNMHDKIRNAVIAAGAISFFSELQWAALLDGFLQKEL